MESYVSADIIKQRLVALREVIPQDVRLVAVSKFQPVASLRAAYEAGQRLFGESRVQELLEKIPALPSDVKWHFIGHLQTNKVKYIIGKTALIESVDSLRLLKLINAESSKAGVVTDILLQIHVAAEETKFGFSPEELLALCDNDFCHDLKNVRIRGLMAMATNTENEDVVKNDFHRAAGLFRHIEGLAIPQLADFDILSMGMSGDWPLAVEEGANLIRIGSAIFGPRY